jgi:hypothetical protein
VQLACLRNAKLIVQIGKPEDLIMLGDLGLDENNIEYNGEAL